MPADETEMLKVETRSLGRSELRVSQVGLGCDNFGDPLGVDESVDIVRRAYDLRVRFFDTADAYGDGRSEEFLGKALGGLPRSEVVIATKFGSALSGAIATPGGASPEYIRSAVNGSLRRLGTDYIDLYQLHEPDPKTPLDDTLGALNDLVDKGKVRVLGCSNLSASEVRASAGTQWPARFESIQFMWNLLERGHEADRLPAAQECGMSVLPWFPLAGGLLTGKYARGQDFPPDSRYERMRDRIGFLAGEAVFERLERLRSVAEASGHTLLEAALGWLGSRGGVACVMPGAMNVAQVEANVAAASATIADDVLAALDAV
ncbi:MAG: aldo/keto reductase [Actinomycetia bacterium]|nr:aldo/keto reductase [Actinomycetes bacterium]